MGQIDVAVKYAKKIETILENKYNAEGKGLHEKLDGLNGILDENIIKKARYIATIRNKVVHEDEYDIEDIEDFIETAKEVTSLLEDHKTEVGVKSVQTNINENFTFDSEKNPQYEEQNPRKKQKTGNRFLKFFNDLAKFLVFMIVVMIVSSFLSIVLEGTGLESFSILLLLFSPVIFYLINRDKNEGKTPTFDGYTKQYPGLLRNGRVKCKKCGSDSIYIQKCSDILSTMQNEHICRTCGTTLYRSRTN